MICCKDKRDEDIIKSLRSHGWARDLSNQSKIEKKYKNIDSKFLFVNSGYNLRPTEINAAIGLSQFKSLNKFNKTRKANRSKIIKKLITNKKWKDQVSFIKNKIQTDPSWFGLPMLINTKYKKYKKKIFNRLDSFGIECRPIISGNFLKQPALKKYYIREKSADFPNANYIHEHGLFVGLRHKLLSEDETNKFVNIFFKSFNIKK